MIDILWQTILTTLSTGIVVYQLVLINKSIRDSGTKTHNSLQLSGAEASNAAHQAKKDSVKVIATVKEAGIATVGVIEEAITKAEEINPSLDDLTTMTKETYALLNVNMGIQLKLNMVLSQRIADMTKDVTDIEAAKHAELLYKEYQAKNGLV